jgi:DNA-binding NarL/FixJ family response regulator
MSAAPELPPVSCLIVEDSWVVAHGLESVLRSFGVSILGPAGTVADALSLARTTTPGVALIDLNLRGRMADEVVDCLIERHVPVILTSGYAREGLPDRFRELPLCSKPYGAEELLRLIKSALAA